MNVDRLAIRILLSTEPQAVKQGKLMALAKLVSNVVNNRIPCPACEDEGPHDDNGAQTYCCRACGEHFDRD